MGARLIAVIKDWRWLLFTFALAGCVANPVRDYCAITSPIRLTKAEYAQLSDESAKQILAANETRAKLCK